MADSRVLNSPMPAPYTIGSKTGWPKQMVRLVSYFELVLIDSLGILGGFFLAARFRDEIWLSPDGINLGFLVLPIYVMLALNRNAYSIDVLRSQSENLRRSLSALFVTMLLVLMLGFFSHAGLLISRLAFGAAIVISGAFMLAGRYLFFRYILARYQGALTDELLILDGVPMPENGCLHVFDAQAERLEPDLQNPKMLGRLATLVHNFDRVIVACPAERQFAWSLFLKGTEVVGELVMPQSNKIGAIGINSFHDRDTMVVSRGPLSLANRAKKRAFDLFFTVPALIALAPLLGLVALAIRLESKGPALFRQPRVGQGNRMFEILKFRSMRIEMCDTNGDQSTQLDDARITRIGNLIRKTSIDELPQLINVLRGDMSLVGPRPHALGSLAGDQLFWEVNERYWLRHALKPGITGLAQIRGFRGATHHRQDIENRLQSDLEYLNGWRLWRDVTILFGTIKVLIHPNAY